ncbi:alpha/beta hydrolase [Sphingobacterium humi]|uniref:Prolyl oligopeptidase family serine peptidase n=1 Tax=Sphingobacterium humi TaxID=1796905 RepID=A0A6N8KXW1_9SPHI|nr:alpha/beta hydrolase family protein [Sphingobacterium humi]MVZ61936.1 prolyl oligopeptidase family serine peptidase [Sphingobacterium humi]
MKIQFTILSFLISLSCAYAAKVDTVAVASKAMGKSIKTVVIRPDQPKQQKMPVLYLLHGYSGDYANWVNKVPAVKELVDRTGIMIVCPDGGYGSWYWDIKGDKNYQYETFVAKELVAYVDGHYATNSDRSQRGITGLSMGGHGAMYLAIRHQDVFSAVGSTAGGVDIRPFPNNWEMAKRLGSYAENPEKWNQHTVMELTHLIQPKSLEIFVDCGTEDFFFAVNEKLHEKLSYLNVPHRYLTMPGGHTWDYWSKSIHYQLAFFSEVFSKAAQPIGKQ